LKLLDQVDERFRQEAENRLNNLLNKGVDFTQPVERLYHRIDGSPVWVELVGARVTHEGREGTVIFFQDIQKRKALEEQTKQMEQFHLAVLDSIPLSIVHYSKETGILFVNRHYKENFCQSRNSTDSNQYLQQMYPDPKIRHQAEKFIEKEIG